MLAAGAILAIKGIGGYHLACDAASDDAVGTLRSRKRREEKPFALMATGIDEARSLVDLTTAEEELLTGRERPIVIARRRGGAQIAEAVAPLSQDLGVMLPYAPLHHVLLRDFGRALVMTSANVSDEPIAYGDDDAQSRLGEIADAFLVHDRPIHMRTDDSVVRSVGGTGTTLGDRHHARGQAPSAPFTPLMMRRSRGFVPQSVLLPLEYRHRSAAVRSSRAHSASPKGAAPGPPITSATSRTGRRWSRFAKESSIFSVSLRSSRR